MKRLLLLFIWAASVFAAQTTISDNVSSVGNVTGDKIIAMSVAYNSFTAADTTSVTAGSTSVTVASDGSFSVALYPNSGTSGVYTVTYTGRRYTYTESLTVPVSGSSITLIQARPNPAVLAASDGRSYLLPVQAATPAGATVALNSITAPTGNLSLSTGGNTQTFTAGSATGSGVNLWDFTDTASNTGTGAILTAETASGSAATPFQVKAAGSQAFSILPTGITQINGNVQCATDGACVLGSGGKRFQSISMTGTTTIGASGSLTWSGRSSLTSPLDGIVRAAASSGTNLAGVQSNVVVVTKTAGYTALFSDSGSFFDNTGATGAVAITLPTAQVGQQYHATVVAAQTFGFTAPAGVVICNSSTCSATGGTITSNVPNNHVWIEAVSSTKWIVVSATGTWTIT